MDTYKVYGPFKIKTKKMKVGRAIENSAISWESLPDSVKKIGLKKKRGVYIFAMRSGGGIKPYYVGKASKSFEAECYASHKLVKYNQALSGYKRGKPVIFFISKPNAKTINKKQLINIENFFIQLSIKRNPRLLNIQGIKQPRWAIKGVIRSNQGKASKSAIEFKSMMRM